MVGKTKNRTQADDARLSILAEYCLPCILSHWDGHGTIQHKTTAGRREEDQNQRTYPACRWHHLGEVPDHIIDRQHAQELLGPSFAHTKSLYEATYGDEEDLILVADAVVRITLSARRRSEYISRRKMSSLVRQIHREITSKKMEAHIAH